MGPERVRLVDPRDLRDEWVGHRRYWNGPAEDERGGPMAIACASPHADETSGHEWQSPSELLQGWRRRRPWTPLRCRLEDKTSEVGSLSC